MYTEAYSFCRFLKLFNLLKELKIGNFTISGNFRLSEARQNRNCVQLCVKQIIIRAGHSNTLSHLCRQLFDSALLH